MAEIKSKKAYVYSSAQIFRVKGTLMQILNLFNQYPENFAFLILRILELFSREVCKFLKK